MVADCADFRELLGDFLRKVAYAKGIIVLSCCTTENENYLLKKASFHAGAWSGAGRLHTINQHHAEIRFCGEQPGRSCGQRLLFWSGVAEWRAFASRARHQYRSGADLRCDRYPPPLSFFAP